MHYAFFAPYTLGQHLALVSEMQSFDGVRLRLLGETLDGHDIDQLQIGAMGIRHLFRTLVELSAVRLAYSGQQFVGVVDKRWFMDWILLSKA